MRKQFSVSFEEIVCVENLLEAWQEFIRGKRNKEDVRVFERSLADGILALHNDLVSGSYCHGTYHHFRIRDPKPRDIHKAAVRDRLLHHAVHRKLSPFFASTFIADSFSCQLGKGLHRALDRFDRLSRAVTRNHTRTGWALKGDIRKFFASVHHDRLLAILRRSIPDPRTTGLLGSIIESFKASPGKGIPLGNLTSQLFSNIYLNEFDQFVKHTLKVKHYLRYADDFLLLSPNREWLESLIPQLEAFLSERLDLHLHPDKIDLRTLTSGLDFLGWIHFPRHRVLRTSTKRRVLKNLRGNPKPETLASYLGLLSHGDTYELRQQILNDTWLWREEKENEIAGSYVRDFFSGVFLREYP
ncbi:MAG TPA: reverse transcriptase/maturase family protein [Patescibacteria group bacterium]|nr:reverse transcriptase/maturase family protein [Patescibacteria group bacterium]